MENFDCRCCAEKIKENINAPVIIAALLGLIAGFVVTLKNHKRREV